MRKFLFIICFALISQWLQAQSKVVTISEAYGSRSQRAYYTVTYKKFKTDYITVYKFGNYTITATNYRGSSNVIVNIKTPGILGANDNITIPYGKCNGYVLYKGGASNLLGSSKLEYLISFSSTEKSYPIINQIMDTETDRYHYSLEPLNQQLYSLSKKIWIGCKESNQANNYNDVNSVKKGLSLKSLSKFKGKITTQSNFFTNTTVKALLSNIMQSDYIAFKTTFLKFAAGVEVEIKDNVLYVYTFRPHWAVDKALLLIDLSNQSCFLYTNIDSKMHVYGVKPLTSNATNFLKEKIKNDVEYLAPEDLNLLEKIVAKFGADQTAQSEGTEN
jgi:hypothetical protein